MPIAVDRILSQQVNRSWTCWKTVGWIRKWVHYSTYQVSTKLWTSWNGLTKFLLAFVFFIIPTGRLLSRFADGEQPPCVPVRSFQPVCNNGRIPILIAATTLLHIYRFPLATIDCYILLMWVGKQRGPMLLMVTRWGELCRKSCKQHEQIRTKGSFRDLDWCQWLGESRLIM